MDFPIDVNNKYVLFKTILYNLQLPILYAL